MEDNVWNFRITPRVLKKDVLQTIEVESLDEFYHFFDGVDYEVKLVCRDGYTRDNFQRIPPLSVNNALRLQVKSENNILRIRCQLPAEGLWCLHIRCLENAHSTPARAQRWPWTNNEREIIIPIYVLADDLYGLQPYKGDLHVHTRRSDADLSPALMASKYRKYGFDFMAITDHYTMQPSLETMERFKSIPTNFRLFPGEEIHYPHPDGGDCVYAFHMVNFNGKMSVNELLQKDREAIEKQIAVRAEALKKEIDTDAEATLVAWYEWIYERIKQGQGVAIYPHPLWAVFGAYNVREATTKEICKRGLLDAIEIGGNDVVTNRTQAQFYYHLREQGYKYPVISSSDAHAATPENRFNLLWTIAFANGKDEIPDAVEQGRVVAIEGQDGEKNVYGDYRLVKYAWFLIKHYFPRHDALCNACGQAIERCVLGDKEQTLLIELLEKEVEKYEKSFFCIAN